eukprot:CAMPEP_0197441774 /NCGR_PEP_ID=MMETSP1175-20131217/7956_1 /TAXON_ID=1003142 /ORGANISM="Triceratium dubium, Strain CCMP147" /LENGTH=648 /DNA_ID=CAMNT_0042972105 /DNA_START=177 /DNA_END=2123 /DNA_ORIENTATION=+
MARETWSSKLAFIFASVGAAVGFGNVWRFPSLCYKFGGGAFFVPYLIALFFIGIPLCVLEIGLGQYHQTGDVGVFGSIHRRLRGVGVSSILCGFLVVTYYVPLISWVIKAFFYSFRDFVWDDVTGSEGYGYFKSVIIGMDTLTEENGFRPNRIVPENVGFNALSWFIVFLCVAFGIKTTGRITYFTMGLPIILLFVFLGRACTLPGASAGIHQYIGIWDMSVLTENPEAWSLAVSQIFFSIGVTFGILTAYGSHCPREWHAFTNSVTISLSNSLYSFIAGFAVFAGLGYLSLQEDLPIDELNAAGPGLLFGAYPAVLATLPGGEHWVRLLFVTLFLLGIDSAFALTEAVLTVMKDTVLAQNKPRWLIVSSTCLLGFLIGILYCTDAGFLFLDVVDFYVNFIMILVGFFEAFSAGWIYGLEDQLRSLGWKPVSAYLFGTFGSVIIASAVWFGLKNDNAVWAGFVTLILFWLAGFAATLHFLKPVKEERGVGWMSILYELLFRNVIALRDEMSSVVGHIPTVWAVIVKHLMPPILFVCFVNLAAAKTDDGQSQFGHYEGYVMVPYQMLGIIIVAFVGLILLVGFTIPHLYACLAVPQIEEDMDKSFHKQVKPSASTPGAAQDEGNFKDEEVAKDEEQQGKDVDFNEEMSA